MVREAIVIRVCQIPKTSIEFHSLQSRCNMRGLGIIGYLLSMTVRLSICMYVSVCIHVYVHIYINVCAYIYIYT